MTTRVPSKNYLILIGIIVLIICACFAFFNIYNILQENALNVSPLSSKQVLYKDLKNTTKEIDADTFLVISFVQDEEVYKNEKDIKKYLTKNNLIDNVTYLDVTEDMTDDKFMDELNSLLKLDGHLKIESFPAVVYYKEGVPTYTVDSKDHLLNKSDFEQLIDIYELAS